MRNHILQLLDELAAEERGGITTAQLRERLSVSEQSASNMLSRLVQAGLLDRVARGSFALRPLGQLGTRAASQDIALAVAAAFSGEPHRIAFRSALDHHGLLIHPARTIQVAMPRRARLQRISGRRFTPIYEARETVSIGSQDAGYGALVSSVERALLESAGRPALIGGWSTIADAVSRAPIDPARIAALSDQLAASVALRRIGSLSQAVGLDELAESLPTPAADARIVALDPREPVEQPWTDRRWRVRWPTSPQRARSCCPHDRA
jgi:predicted transcriptional regulator of viral defense system